jgi:hypothetical protein
VKHFKSSSKVVELTDEIKDLENRSMFLAQRNERLTARLMQMQATTVSKAFNMGKAVMRQRVFKAWVEIRLEIRLERHLEEQTHALESCKQVATDLGMALKQEQDLRMNVEDAAHQLQDQVGGAQIENDKIRQRVESLVAKKAFLQKRLGTVEDHLERKHNHAQAVISEGQRYETRKRDINTKRKEKEQLHMYSLEDSKMMRGEVHETMQQVKGLLPPSSPMVSPPLSPTVASRRAVPAAPVTFTYTSSPQSYTIPPQGHPSVQYVSAADQALNRLEEFRQRYPARSAVEIADAVFTRIDTDGDGAITREEFDRAQRDGMLHREELIRQAAAQTVSLPLPQRRVLPGEQRERLGTWQVSEHQHPPVDGFTSPMPMPPMLGSQSMPIPHFAQAKGPPLAQPPVVHSTIQQLPAQLSPQQMIATRSLPPERPAEMVQRPAVIRHAGSQQIPSVSGSPALASGPPVYSQPPPPVVMPPATQGSPLPAGSPPAGQTRMIYQQQPTVAHQSSSGTGGYSPQVGGSMSRVITRGNSGPQGATHVM